MKLYYSPGACSLADHIALHEAGLSFEHERVDLKAKTTETGADFAAINPKGYVPVLVTDEDETITENAAILDWIAFKAPSLVPPVRLARTRLLEALAYISSELHKNFKPFFAGGSDDDKAAAGKAIGQRLGYLADRMAGDYLFGDSPSAADCYLFVMLLWAGKNGVEVPPPLAAMREWMTARPAVQTAMKHEGLI